MRQGLLDRHEALRTRFVLDEGELTQHIDASARLDWSVAEAHGETDFERWMDAQHHRSFDLATGPLFRAALLRREEGAVLALGMHHIVGDGWSAGLLLKELLTDYAARTGALNTPRAANSNWRSPSSSTPISPNGRRNG